MKKNIIAIIIIAVILGIIGTVLFVQCAELDEAGKIISRPYTGEQTKGFEKILNSSDNFALGVNKYGQPVFVDRDKAYEQLLVACKGGIEAVRKVGDLPDISKKNMDAYGSVGAELSEMEFDRDIIEQAAFIGVFYDFYCHSDDDFYV